MTMMQVILAVVAALASASIVAGVAIQWTVAFGLITGGVLALAGVVVLYDPDHRKPRR